MQPYLSHLRIENFNWKNLPLILGYRNLFETKSTIELGDHNLTIGWKTEKLYPPINLKVSEYLHPQFHPTPQAEKGLPNKDFVREENRTKKETKKAVDHDAMEEGQPSQLEWQAGTEKPNDTKDVTTLAEATKASVPFNYEAHTEPGQVCQIGTEQISQ